MNKILLPLDGSSCSEAAIAVAKDLASSLGASIVLVTIGNLPETSTMAREEEGELNDLLKRLAAEHDLGSNMKVDMGGDPVQGILRIAEEEGVDLIVMATHGRSGLSDLAQGSVAREIIRDGRLPVLLVRPKQSNA
jgi:nucleotide-binding universal stress UspA family protein